MNINSNKMSEFLCELIREQTSLSNQIEKSSNQKQILKNIKDINQIITQIYLLEETINKQKEISTKKK